MAEEAVWVGSCSSRVQLWTIMRRFITSSGSIYFSRETKEKETRCTRMQVQSSLSPLGLTPNSLLLQLSLSLYDRKEKGEAISALSQSHRLFKPHLSYAWHGKRMMCFGMTPNLSDGFLEEGDEEETQNRSISHTKCMSGCCYLIELHCSMKTVTKHEIINAASSTHCLLLYL